MLGRLATRLRGKGTDSVPPDDGNGSYTATAPTTAGKQATLDRNRNHAPSHSDASCSDTRKDRGSSSDRIGLFAVTDRHGRPASDSGPVDVIAVHGLNGNPHSTWTHPVSGTMWLKDILPSYVPECRVYTFGYASKVKHNPSVATVPDFARSLLDSLRNLREEMGKTRRPIIFICHSLGGIVCKQALVYAHLDRKRYGDVLDSTIGIVFLGTPHCGSNIADMTAVLGRVINSLSATTTLGLRPNIIKHDLLEALAYDSKSLQELDLSVRHLLGQIMITSFYETLPLPPLKTPVVTRQSAVLGLPQEDVLPLHLNHRDICRFERRTTECVSVCQAIRRIQASAQHGRANVNRLGSRSSSESDLDNIDISCLRLLSQFDLKDYKSALPAPVRGTCTWVRSHPSYVSWIEDKQNTILWLMGHAGCGKTVLSNSIATQLKEEDHYVLSYFCDKNISAQQDGRAILTGLIFQIVYQNRRFLRYVRREFEIRGISIVQSLTTLLSLFKGIIKHLDEDLIHIVIDGFDECEVSSGKALLSVINEMTERGQSFESGKTIKFLLTSRPKLHFTSATNEAKEGYLVIDDGEPGYTEGIRQFIHQRVDDIALKHRCPEHTKRYLLDALISKAENTYLWTNMILSSLEDSLLASRSDFISILAKLPPNLESTYSSFIAKIPKPNLPVAHRLLSIILASSRNLNHDEINYAFTIANRHQSSEEILQDCQPAISQTLQGALGPLVRISDRQVALVHQSLREFLLESEGNALHKCSDQACSSMPALTSKGAALTMANACITYLLLEDFQDRISSSVSSEGVDSSKVDVDDVKKIADGGDIWEQDDMSLNLFRETESVVADISTDLALRHKFYDYSATNWYHHYAICESIATSEVRRSAMTLLQADCIAGRTWRDYVRSKAIGEAHEFPGESGSLVFSSYLDLKQATIHLLQSGHCLQQEKDEALFWAASRGHSHVVSLLLEAGADPANRGVNNQTSLLMSAANGHLECVQQIVQASRSILNIKGKWERTPLSLAAGNGHAEVVQYLLNDDTMLADLGDDSGATAFIWASGRGHPAIILALAKDRRVDVNAQDRHGRTALSWAAGDGMEEVVNLLLKRVQQIDPNSQDKTGRTAFSWGAGNGQTGVLRTLACDRRVDKYQKDLNRRSPLSWACGNGHEEAVRFLLANEPRGLEDQDIDGWSPMAWAIQHDVPGLVHALFDAGARNLEDEPRSILSWAVSYGHLSVVQLLLAKGANPESAEDEIPFARSMNRSDLVEELSRALSRQGLDSPE